MRATLLTIALLGAACGGVDGDSADTTETTAPATTAPTTTTTTPTTTTAPTTTTTLPTTTTVASQPGVLTMDFGDHSLTYDLDDCPVATLADGGSWLLARAGEELAADDVDGSTWMISGNMSGEGDSFLFFAIAPGEKPYYIANFNKVSGETEVEGSKLTLVTTFQNAVFEGEAELELTLTIECQG